MTARGGPYPQHFESDDKMWRFLQVPPCCNCRYQHAGILDIQCGHDLHDHRD